MNCRRVDQLLSDELEGQIPEREGGPFQAHLRDCPACRRRREEFAAVRAGMRELARSLPIQEAAVGSLAIDRWMTLRDASGGSGRRLPGGVRGKVAGLGEGAALDVIR